MVLLVMMSNDSIRFSLIDVTQIAMVMSWRHKDFRL